jgi:hypothetical protein
MVRRGDGGRVCASEGDGLFVGDFNGCEDLAVLDRRAPYRARTMRCLSHDAALRLCFCRAEFGQQTCGGHLEAFDIGP